MTRRAVRDGEPVRSGDAITVSGAQKVFETTKGTLVEAVAGVDLTVGAGEFVSIVGPSGCGKSTLLYMVGGFEDLSGGSIVALGAEVSRPGRDRAMVFQQFALLPWKSVLGNVEVGLPAGLSRAERRRRAQDMVDMVGLTGSEKLYPHEISGGMQQRVAIARALAMDSPILLMDEPFGALDAQTRVLLQEELNRIQQEAHKSVLFITHAVDEALFLSDRIYVFGPRPASVVDVLDVAFPRPRAREELLRMPEYAELHARIWEQLRQ